ncbi:MAG: hypothetical protein L3J28_09240 [Candidatus Polarisedimenticolaceae bacterium]|nr:hypothetical protein [Candidatus Polarisedimenticolaceae bacterium]
MKQLVKKLSLSLTLLAGILLFSLPVQADNLMMVRSKLPFLQAEALLKAQIEAHGYTISSAKRIDIDLVAIGMTKGAYRVVQFGKPNELKKLANAFPEMIPFLPLQVVIFAEWEETLFVTLSPAFYSQIAPQGELAPIYTRWAQDLGSILNMMRQKGAEY